MVTYAKQGIHRTAWYPRWIKPARPGVYEVRRLNEIAYAFWDGTYWALASCDPAYAYALRHQGIAAGMIWRGLDGEVS